MRKAVCAAKTLVTLGGKTKTAPEWAAERGLKWHTVKMRRYRGAGWEEALRPELHARSWMEGWSLAG